MSSIESRAESPAAAGASIPNIPEGAPRTERDALERPDGRGELLRLPEPAAALPGEALERWRAALRRFHLTGADPTLLLPPSPGTGLEPAVLRSMLDAADPARAWPLAILGGEAGHEIVALSEVLDRAVERAAAGGEPLEILGRSVPVMVRAAQRDLIGESRDAGIAAVLGRVLDRMGGELDLSAAGAAALGREVERLRPQLPRTGTLVPLSPRTLLSLFAAAVREHRRPGRAALRAEIERLVESMADLLRLDDARAPEGRAPAALSAELAAGSAFLDARALSRQLPAHHGSRRLDPLRRARIERAAAALGGWLAQCADEPDLLLVLAQDLDSAEGLEGCRVIRDEDGLRAAIGLFDAAAAAAVETVRALRTARLEVAGGYDPAAHDEPLERIEWRSFAAEELPLMQALAVVVSGRRLRGAALASWSMLLRSGRPVQVLVVESTGGADAQDAPDGLAGYHPGLGYLAMAHRETFVLQSSLGRPAHLAAGFGRMAAVPGPATALVTVPQWHTEVPPWLQLVAAEGCRAAACLRYDPQAGETWAERFDLEGNPQPERAWPVYRVSYRDGGGAETSREDAFTFAHAAALDPVFHPHFRVVPPEAWTDEMVEIGAWLEAEESVRLRSLPFVWIVGDGGRLARAVMTRELAFACRDRARAWRILQELAGLHNEHARRAAERAREEARAAAQEERRALETAHAEALERVRAEAAREVMDRLVAVLLETGSAPAPAVRAASTMPRPAPPVEATAPAAEQPAAAAEAEPEPQVSFDEPYIDSVLCTTCNECTQLNPRMFAYNQNRQATIADAAAGTFEQLVRAAEKCPARCIHPGAPRAGDATATPDWIARARPFNP